MKLPNLVYRCESRGGGTPTAPLRCSLEHGHPGPHHAFQPSGYQYAKAVKVLGVAAAMAMEQIRKSVEEGRVLLAEHGHCDEPEMVQLRDLIASLGPIVDGWKRPE